MLRRMSRVMRKATITIKSFTVGVAVAVVVVVVSVAAVVVSCRTFTPTFGPFGCFIGFKHC